MGSRVKRGSFAPGTEKYRALMTAAKLALKQQDEGSLQALADLGHQVTAQNDPANTQTLHDLGKLMLHVGRASEAAACLKQAHMLTGQRDPELHTMLIQSLQRAGKLDEAIAEIEMLTKQIEAALSSEKKQWKYKSKQQERAMGKQFMGAVLADRAFTLVALRSPDALRAIEHARKHMPGESFMAALHATSLDWNGKHREARHLFEKVARMAKRGSATYQQEMASSQPFARAANKGDRPTPVSPADSNTDWSGGGGWALAGTEGTAADNECDIDRRTGLSVEEFVKEYASIGKPVIVHGVIDDWPARQSWSKSALLKARGSARVNIANSSVITMRQIGDADRSTRVALSEYVEEVMAQSTNEDPPYLFKTKQLPKLSDDYKHPALFDNFTWTHKQREDKALFFLGPKHSGAYFHHHSAAFNALVHGSKAWYLLPPLAHYGPEVGTMREWLRVHSQGLPTAPLRCVQRSGEVLFVPSGWQHGVLNLENSVGIAIEVGELKLPRKLKAQYEEEALVSLGLEPAANTKDEKTQPSLVVPEVASGQQAQEPALPVMVGVQQHPARQQALSDVHLLMVAVVVLVVIVLRGLLRRSSVNANTAKAEAKTKKAT
jgi:tetratricopeptide (TPR) repeat protein